MGNLHTIGDIIGMLRRRALLIVVIAAVGMLLSLNNAMNLPRSYNSIAVIQVESPRVVDPTAREVAGGPTSFRLQAIQQQVMSRENIVALMARHGLDDAFAALNEVQRVVLMRESISLQNILPGPAAAGGTDVTALLISVTLGDPQVAAAVANDVADQIMDLGTSREMERINEALAFFRSEEARISAAVVALEGEITRFKTENVEALPEAIGPRREEAARLDEALRELGVQRIELEAERSTLLASGNLRTVGQRQLDTLDSRLGLLADQATALQTRRDALTEALLRAPSVESTLSSYARSLQQLQDQYAVTTRRLAEAETGRKLAENQKTERMSILERAEPALYASGSGRKKVAVMGAAAAVLVALAAAVLLDLMNPVLRTAGQMERAVGIRPFVAIPYIPNATERVRKRSMRVAGIGAAAFALVTVVALAGVYTLGA